MSQLTIAEYPFNITFYPAPENDGSWIASYIHSGDFVCNYDENLGGPASKADASGAVDNDTAVLVCQAFGAFKVRPEYLMYSYTRQIDLPAIVTSDNILGLKDMYDNILAGAMLVRYTSLYKDPNVGIKRVQSALDWLEGNKFYESPGSTRFHDAYKGGLLLHSLRVLNHMIELRQLKYYAHETVASLALTALMHDWCKIGLYHSYMKNVKNDDTGKWEQQEAFKRDITGIPLGHGETSLYYAQKFVSLTDEEALAIRWHMNMFNCCNSEVDELELSNEKYPLVHMLQFADQLSITEYANN